MVSRVGPEELIEYLEPLCAGLHQALDDGADRAGAHFLDHGMTDHPYAAVQSHLNRAHAHQLLTAGQARGELGDWRVVAGNNLQTCLTLHDTLTVRLLRPVHQATPPPGSNRAWIAYWSNAHDSIFGVAGSRLIGLWSIGENGESAVRVVRPVGPWKWRERERVDIDFWLPRRANELYDLEFVPSAEDIDVELPGFEQDGTQDQGSEDA